MKSSLGLRRRAVANSGKSPLMAPGVHFDYSDNVNQEHLEKHSAKPSELSALWVSSPVSKIKAYKFLRRGRIESVAGNKTLDYAGRGGSDGMESIPSEPPTLCGGGSLPPLCPVPPEGVPGNTGIWGRWGRRYLEFGHNPAGIIFSCQVLHI